VRGLEQASWPGRFEVVQREPYIILDGAHNPHAARALREDVRRYRERYALHKSALLFGVLRDKAYQTMAEILFPDFDEIVLVKPDSPRALEPSALLSWAPAAKICDTISEGLDVARASGAELICVTGSLYVIGAAKRLFL
jgi:dihydrofolate synthase/folylpolyglutamate synthase